MDYKCSASTARRLFIGPQDLLHSHMWSVRTSLSLPFSFLPSMKDKVPFDLVFYKYNWIPLFSLFHSRSDGYSDIERECGWVLITSIFTMSNPGDVEKVFFIIPPDLLAKGWLSLDFHLPLSAQSSNLLSVEKGESESVSG